MHTVILFVVASLAGGLLIGSFLNVCIRRIPVGASIVRPGSRCPECQTPIRWYNNIPVLSYALLRGRCPDCHKRIPLHYPLVEVATALWFGLTAAQFSGMEQHPVLVLGLISQWILGSLLIALTVIDWQTQMLPDALTIPGMVAAFLLICTRALFLGPGEGQILLARQHIQISSPGAAVDPGNVFMTGPEALILGRIFAAIGAACLLLVIRAVYGRIRHREGLGLGDVKLMGMIAGFLGFWPAIVALFLGVIAATTYSVYLLARGRAGGGTRIAFGSFLAAGGLAAAVFGGGLIQWYSGLLR